MTVLSVIGGVAFIAAAFAFHVRAQLLGDHGQGWPEAPKFIRWAIDAALLPMVLAGIWWVFVGSLPQWLSAFVAVGLATYGGAMAFNVARQRGTPPEAGE